MKPSKIELIKDRFCEVSGMSEQEYQTRLFELGCEFAEKNYIEIPSYSDNLKKSKLYWRWWQGQFAQTTVMIMENFANQKGDLREDFEWYQSIAYYLARIFPPEHVLEEKNQKIEI